jgi:ankyrin repeat protein
MGGLQSTPTNQVLPFSNISLMHIAAFYDSLDCFVYLESKSLQYNQESAGSYLPIHYACLNGAYEVVCYILNKDPEQAKILPAVENHLLLLATMAGDSEILGLLLRHGANLTAPANVKNNPVATAIQRQHVDCLRLLLTYRVTNQRDVAEYTALMLAINASERDAIPLLLDCGENPSYINPRRMSALFLACWQGKEWLDVVQLICRKATKLDLDEGIKHKAAIHWACSSKCPEIVEAVLQQKVDVNRKDEKGYTGVHYLLDACPEDDLLKILELMHQYGLELGGDNVSILADLTSGITKPYRAIEWIFAHGIDPDERWNGLSVADMMGKDQQLKQIYAKYCEPTK